MLVTATHYDLRARLEPHLPGRIFGKDAGNLVRRGHPAEPHRVEVGGREHLRCPVFVLYVVEHGGRGVGIVDHHLVGEAVYEKASRKEKGRGVPVNFRLLVAQPEYLGGHVGGVEVEPGDLEDALCGDPFAEYPALGFGPTVHPDDGGPQVTAPRVDGDHAVDLASQTESPDVGGRYPAPLEQRGYDLPQSPKPIVRVLFRPPRLRERELVGGGSISDTGPLGIDQDALEALRTHVAPDHVRHTLPPLLNHPTRSLHAFSTTRRLDLPGNQASRGEAVR